MRKIIIVCLLAAVVFAGCSKATSHTETRKPAAAGEPSLTEVTNEMDKEFEEKIKAIDDMGNEVIENIRTEASKAVSEIKAAIPTTITTIPEPKEIELNVETVRGDGTLTFKSVKLYYNNTIDKNMAVFSYETEDEKAIMPIEKDTVCIGVSGNPYEAKGMGGTGNKGEIHFYDITDFSDLSTVTLTYAFDGYDPVTVEFEIPGL